MIGTMLSSICYGREFKGVHSSVWLCSLSKYNHAIIYIYKQIKPISNMF